MTLFVSSCTEVFFGYPKYIQDVITSHLPHCYHFGLEPSSLTGIMAVGTPPDSFFCVCPSTIYPPQNNQRNFNNIKYPTSSCLSSAQNPPMTPILLRVKVEVFTLAHKVLHILPPSPLKYYFLPLSPSLLLLQAHWLLCLSLKQQSSSHLRALALALPSASNSFSHISA